MAPINFRIINSFLLLLILLLLGNCSSKNNYIHNSENFSLSKLGDGVFACIHKIGGKAICNVGIVDTGEETLIFDTFLSPIVAEELLEIVEKLKLSPIKYVVNSHSHNDHIRGNQVFAENVQIISTKKTTELIEEWELLDIKEEKEWAPARYHYYDSLHNAFSGDTNSREFQLIQMWRPYYEVLSNSYKEVKTRMPTVFVEEKMVIKGRARNVELICKGAGHTESDLILYLPNDKIIFTGDLVFNNCHPYIAHGEPEAWKNYLTYIHNLPIDLVVPGHGELGTKSELTEMKNYIINLEKLVENMIKEDIPIENVAEIEIPAQYKDYWFDRFFVPNLKFIYSRFKGID